MNKIFIKSSLAIAIFLVSVFVSLYPINKKGFAIAGDFTNLSVARNFSVSNTYRTERIDGMLLSSSVAAKDGKISGISNPLTPIIYGRIFQYSEALDLAVKPEIVAVLMAALFNALLFLLISYLFGTMVGFASALIVVFMPVRLAGALYYGSYEFAMLFFICALWAYFISRKTAGRFGLSSLIFSSILFALAALARNAFLISFIPFVVFDFYKTRSYKRALVLLLPFLVVFGLTLTPYSWLGLPNGYTAGIDSQPSTQINHVFEDSYSAYYNRDKSIENMREDGLDRLETHFLSQWGYGVSWLDKLSAYKDSATYYIVETFNLINLGGPILILIMLIGSFWLYKNDKDMLILFGIWTAIWLAGLVYFETANWDHFLEVIFIAGSLCGLGLYQLWHWLAGFLSLKKGQQYSLGLILIIFIVGHLVYADKWRLYDSYRSSYMGAMIKYSELVSEGDGGAIAVGVHPGFADGIYYFSNRDVIYFSPNTVTNLIKDGGLSSAFKKYNVATVVGFNGDLSLQINKLTGLKVVAWEESYK